MIVILKNDPNPKQVDNLIQWLKSLGMEIHESKGQSTTIIGLVGDPSGIETSMNQACDTEEDV